MATLASQQVKALIARAKETDTPVVLIRDNDIRLVLAYSFSGLFVVTIILALALTFSAGQNAGSVWTTMKDVLGVLLPAETGLLGSIMGFYFGSKSKSETSGETTTPSS